MKKSGNWLSRWKAAFLPSFACAVFFCLSVPIDILYSNATELPFHITAVLWMFAVLLLGATLIASLIISLFRGLGLKLVCGLLAAVTLCANVQNLFLNGGLTILDGTAASWLNDQGFQIVNLFIWLAILAAGIAVVLICKSAWRPIVSFASVVMIAMNLSGAVTSIINYPEPASVLWYPDRTNVYQMSSDENILLFMVDSFSNGLLDVTLEAYPDALDGFADFTYYRNFSELYQATHYAFLPMLTANYYPADAATMSDAFNTLWKSENATYFYEGLAKAGYDMQMYVSYSSIADDAISPLVSSYFSNVKKDDTKLEIHKEAFLENTAILTLYRSLPYVFKPTVAAANVDFEEMYVQISAAAKYSYNNRNRYNYLKKLNSNNENKLFAIYHYFGAHSTSYIQADGSYTPEKPSSNADSGRGNLQFMEDILDKLREAGVYDHSTIIFVADHRNQNVPSYAPICLYKPANTRQDSIVWNNAPVNQLNIVPTLAKAAGLDSAPLGKALTEINEGDDAERLTFFYGKSNDLPDNEGKANVFFVYRIDGDANDFESFQNNLVDVIPLNAPIY